MSNDIAPTPIMSWDSEDPYDANGIIVWWSRLDDRWQIEVQRDLDGDPDGYRGNLYIFDHDNDNNLIHDQAVGISYGAPFGPDMLDVAMWQEAAVNIVDGGDW